MNNQKVSSLLSVLIIFLLSSISVHGQFTAKMHYLMSDKERVFQIYCDGNNYRYEFNEDGQEGVVIALEGAKQLIILMPQQKMAIKTSATGTMGMANDPLQMINYYKEDGRVKEIGEETVNGYECIKSEIWNNDESTNQKLFTFWYSEEYHFIIKMISHIDVTGTTEMELKEIKPWIPEGNSFEIPAEYTVMEQ